MTLTISLTPLLTVKQNKDTSKVLSIFFLTNIIWGTFINGCESLSIFLLKYSVCLYWMHQIQGQSRSKTSQKWLCLQQRNWGGVERRGQIVSLALIVPHAHVYSTDILLNSGTANLCYICLRWYYYFSLKHPICCCVLNLWNLWWTNILSITH